MESIVVYALLFFLLWLMLTIEGRKNKEFEEGIEAEAVKRAREIKNHDRERVDELAELVEVLAIEVEKMREEKEDRARGGR